ncbi:hypothetical protein [Synechocystis sp. PCC 7509]|uniref:hypothetical protein n=1 Tax=Synechocystis sp. PCC 7509 TaxID=927677 RepID=UPI0002ABE69D|nr:hypothetical protein [Synechocystis sp. PCC 7509]
MNIFLCPGFHLPQLTQCFLQELLLSAQAPSNLLANTRSFSVQSYTVLSALHITHDLVKNYGQPPQTAPILLIGFSAGVIGALGAAWGWELRGGKVKAVIAIDGWGVPLVGNFPIHTLSHDYFTHKTSINLSCQEDSFYADPGIEHLQMWRSPSTVKGWVVSPHRPLVRSYLSEAEFILMLLKRYQEIE